MAVFLAMFTKLCESENSFSNLNRLDPAWIISDDDGDDGNKNDHDSPNLTDQCGHSVTLKACFLQLTVSMKLNSKADIGRKGVILYVMLTSSGTEGYVVEVSGGGLVSVCFFSVRQTTSSLVCSICIDKIAC